MQSIRGQLIYRNRHFQS